MIVLITGASHTGKTLLSQKLVEQLHFPCLSIDLLKMGLIRSGQTPLTPQDDAELTPYLWSIVREMLRTAIENGQNLIVEGGYIPFGWERDFTDEERRNIRYLCLVMRRGYIESHFSDLLSFASVIEVRKDDSDCTKAALIAENAAYETGGRASGYRYYEIGTAYDPADILQYALQEIGWDCIRTSDLPHT